MSPVDAPLTLPPENERVQKVGLDVVAFRNMLHYGQEIIANQFPHPVDGLKVPWRRILFALRAMSKNTSAQSAVAEVRKLHNHGDQSIYDTVVRLSVPFAFRPQLIQFESENGDYAGNPAAAMRYTELTISKAALDIFFDVDVEKVCPKKLAGDRARYEPIHLVPAVPMALIMGCDSIGFGFPSLTAPGNFGAVCDLTIAYVEHRLRHPVKPFPFDRHADKLIPDFPVENIITNAGEVLAEYKKGNYKARVTMDGVVKVTGSSITVETMPFGTKFGTVRDLLLKETKVKDSWFDKAIAGIRELSNEVDRGRLEITLRQKVDVFEAWERIRRLIQFSGSLTPIPNYTTDDGYKIEVSPPVILATWYQRRCDILLADKRQQMMRKHSELRLIEAKKIIRDRVREVTDIIINNTSEAGIAALQAAFELTYYQALSLVKAEIGTLAKDSREELQIKYEKAAADLEALQRSLSHIGEEIVEQVRRLKKLYGTPRVTRIPNYIGYVALGSGLIQFEDKAEIKEIAEQFPTAPLAVHMYDGPELMWVQPNGRPSTAVIPKIAAGDIYGMPFKREHGYTVNIAEGAACCVHRIEPGFRSQGYFYTTKLAKAITRQGVISTIDVTDPTVISQRKSICRGAATDFLYVYPNTTEPHFLLFTNDQEPNMLVVQRVTDGASRVPVSPVGTLSVLHSYTGKDWYFTVPPEIVHRIKVRVFHIADADLLLGDARQLRIDIAQAKWKRHSNFSMLA